MDLKAAIRTIPDYPKAGIMFRDITTLLSDARAFRRAVDELVLPFAGQKIDSLQASRHRPSLMQRLSMSSRASGNKVCRCRALAEILERSGPLPSRTTKRPCRHGNSARRMGLLIYWHRKQHSI